LVRNLLYALLIAGLSGIISSPGTFSTFAATTDNMAEFATGTLVLSNQKNTATACLSTGGTSATLTDGNAADCDIFFNLLAQKSLSQNMKVTIMNTGSVDASSLQLTWAGGTTPCTTVDAANEGFNGTGDLCGAMRLQVMEYPSHDTQFGNDRGLDPLTGLSSHCWFGGNAGTDACAYNNGQDLAAFDFYDGTDGAHVLDLGPIAAGATRWFRLYANIPAGQFTNALMGRQVDFGFRWTAVQ
jgi:hypothetical protein